MRESVGIQAGRICPGCGREESIPIVWGMPSGDLFELAERGLVSLGGCLLDSEGDPAWSCRACGLGWGREGDPTADEQALADALGVGWSDVVRVLGTGWRREPAGEDDGMQWFVSGEPAQVSVGVEGRSFVLARPLVDWGPRRDVEPSDGGRFTREHLLWFPDDVTAVAEAIASRRRRSFRWCRTCRRPAGPEAFDAPDMACASCDAAYGRFPE